MSDKPKSALNFNPAFAKDILKAVMRVTFGKCEVEMPRRRGKGTVPCGALSMTWTCADCGKMTCNSHGYIPLTLPPQVVCSACLAATEGAVDA